MGAKVHNQTDMIINKGKLTELLAGEKYKDFHQRLVTRFRLGLDYRSFMNLLDNRVTWRLLYAGAIAKELNVSIEELFEFVELSSQDV